MKVIKTAEAHTHSHSHGSHGSHHVPSARSLFLTFAALLCLTVITVVTARFDFAQLNPYFLPLQVDLQPMNIILAMFIATIKTVLVGAFFMGLRYEKAFTVLTFVFSFVFLGIFIMYTLADTLYRGRLDEREGVRLPFESPVKVVPEGTTPAEH